MRQGAHASSAVAPIGMVRLNSLAGYLIRRAQLWVFNDLIETLAPLNISPVQYSVLTVISENPGLSQMALAHALKILRSGMVPLIDGLEQRGLVKRAPSATDRRSHALHLTDEGRVLLARVEVLVAEHEKRLVRKIGPRAHKQLLDALAVFGRK
jgi:DNA-binding MarR family transcriptional regulator